MICKRAEDRFIEGRKLLAGNKPRKALTLFRDAIEIERQGQNGGDVANPRYHSYYGLCLCLCRTDLRQALDQCRLAAKQDGLRPDIWWNLGRVALSGNRRGEAYRALTAGLRIQPGHEGMLGDLKVLGLRRPPVVAFLSRQSRLNVMLGKWRDRLGQPVLQNSPLVRS